MVFEVPSSLGFSLSYGTEDSSFPILEAEIGLECRCVAYPSLKALHASCDGRLLLSMDQGGHVDAPSGTSEHFTHMREIILPEPWSSVGALPGIARTTLSRFKKGTYEVSATSRREQSWAFAVSDRLEREGAVVVYGDDTGCLGVVSWPATRFLHVADLAMDERAIVAVDDYLHKLAVIDLHSLGPPTELTVLPEGPYSCDVNSDMIAISYKLTGRISLLDRISLHVLRDVSVRASGPSYITFSTRDRLASASAVTGVVSEFKLPGGELIRTSSFPCFAPAHAPFSRPRGLALTERRSALLCDAGQQRILEVDLRSGRIVQTWRSPGRFPRAATLWRDLLVVADGVSGNLHCTDLDGMNNWRQFDIADRAGDSWVLGDPHHLVSSGDMLVITDSLHGEVHWISANGQIQKSSRDVPALVLNDPHAAVPMGNEFWVVDSLNDRIISLPADLSGYKVVARLPTGSYPRAVATAASRCIVSARDGLYLLDGERRFSKLCVSVSGVAVPFLEPPRSIVYWDEQEAIVVVDYDRGQIYLARWN